MGVKKTDFLRGKKAKKKHPCPALAGDGGGLKSDRAVRRARKDTTGGGDHGVWLTVGSTGIHKRGEVGRQKEQTNGAVSSGGMTQGIKLVRPVRHWKDNDQAWRCLSPRHR